MNDFWRSAGKMTVPGLFGMFDEYDNPADDAMGYMNQIPGQLHQSFDPYINAGNRALPGLEGQYNQLMNDPGGRLNQIGQGYHQSPGFQFALQQALQGAGHAQAAGGMAGSPQHEQMNMELATQLGNKDYSDWIHNAMMMYGQGLQGNQGLYDTGANAGMRLGENLGSVMGNQGNLAFERRNAQNQYSQGRRGALLGAAGTIGGAFIGGIPGAMMGSQLGRMGGGY